MKRDWDNPERTKQSKMVLIYFLVWRVFTKQGLGAASKPNCCFSIRAFIEASEQRHTYSCGVTSEFLQNHVICARVQPCILFWGWIFLFSVIDCWQMKYYSLSLLGVYTEPFPASWSFSTRWYLAQSVIETGHGCSWGR